MNEYGVSWYSIAGFLIGFFIVYPIVKYLLKKYDNNRLRIRRLENENEELK